MANNRWPIVRRGLGGSAMHVETEWDTGLDVPNRVVCDTCGAGRHRPPRQHLGGEAPGYSMSQVAFSSACLTRHKSAVSPTASGSEPREGPRLVRSEEISDVPGPRHVPAAAAILEPRRICECGCGTPVSIARKTDARTGAVKGEYLRFVRGHASRLHHKRLEFADVTAAWFDAHVTIDIVKGCWLADFIQVTVAGRRVYMAHIALLLSQGLPVTANALDWLRVRRCRRLHCVRPDHMVDLGESPEALHRAQQIETARARMTAFKAERAAAARRTP
jgi:hypothetical protein